MSIHIENWMVQKFSTMVHFQAEQKVSKLLGTVVQEPDMSAEAKAVSRLGTTQDAPSQILERHGDTPIGNTQHSRRWIFPGDYEVPADLIDTQDKVRLLLDPDSHYVIRHSAVMARGLDDAVIAAAGGAAAQGQYGPNGQASLVALPSSQKIPHGNTGLTIAKLLEIREMLDEADVDEAFPRFYVGTPKQRTNLLNTTEVSSSDYNTVKALAEGRVDTFMGFKFIWLSSKRMPLLSAGVRANYAYVQPAIRLGIAIHPTSSVDKRPDKRNAFQVYTHGSWGAVRVEDELVVEVACFES